MHANCPSSLALHHPCNLMQGDLKSYRGVATQFNYMTPCALLSCLSHRPLNITLIEFIVFPGRNGTLAQLELLRSIEVNEGVGEIIHTLVRALVLLPGAQQTT